MEFLWKRESYPSPKIAAAWVYKVINPLINIFEAQLDYISNRNLEFDMYHPGNLKELQRIHQKYNFDNYEQFYEFYADIYKLIQNHDEIVAVVFLSI